MDLLEEYRNQNNWRDWPSYLEKLPLNENQVIYDLGCSIGSVSKMLSGEVRKVVGYDNNEELLGEAMREKPANCEFLIEDIFTLDPESLENCDGIWMSFVLAYMEKPSLFISNWMKCLNHGGWFAIVDIDHLFSGHLSAEDHYLEEIKTFEEHSKGYDFKMGSKIESLMLENGLEIIVKENNWYDVELNFKGSAHEDVMRNWKARLDRMVRLKDLLGVKYDAFCTHFLNEIGKESHVANGCVKFYVGIKR